MNLHNLVRGAVGRVNPDIVVGLRRSVGYTKDANFKQVPQYEDLSGPAQVQAMSAGQLRHAAEMNIQGVMRRVYLNGNWMGVVRSDEKGGDLLTFPQVPGGAVQTWKVFAVFETFPDWCCVGVVLQ